MSTTLGKLEVAGSETIQTRRPWSSWMMRYQLYHAGLAFMPSSILDTSTSREAPVMSNRRLTMQAYPSLGTEDYATVMVFNKRSWCNNPNAMKLIMKDFAIDWAQSEIMYAMSKYATDDMKDAGEKLKKAVDKGAEIEEAYEEIQDARKERIKADKEANDIRPIRVNAQIIVEGHDADIFEAAAQKAIRTSLAKAMVKGLDDPVPEASTLKLKSIKSFKKVLEKKGPKVSHAVIEVEIDTTRKYLSDVEDAFTNARRISKVMTRHTSAEVDGASIEVRISKKSLDTFGKKVVLFFKAILRLREGALVDDGKVKIKFKGSDEMVTAERRRAALLHSLYMIQKWQGRGKYLRN